MQNYQITRAEPKVEVCFYDKSIGDDGYSKYELYNRGGEGLG